MADNERTFTQEEVNRIVSDRLNVEKGKHDAAMAQREAEIARRESMLRIKEDFHKRGWDAALAEELQIDGDRITYESAVNVFEKLVAAKNKPEVSPLPRFGGSMRGTGHREQTDQLRDAFMDYRKE